MPGGLDPIVRSVSLRCSVEEAFDVWTHRIHLWWPVARISLSRDPNTRVIMEGRVGGRLFERTKNGREHDWGRIIRWEPPRRIVYEWFLQADPTKASEIDVTFRGQEDGTTTVVVEHGRWEHAAEDVAEEHRRCVAAPEGWTGILDEYKTLSKADPPADGRG